MPRFQGTPLEQKGPRFAGTPLQQPKKERSVLEKAVNIGASGVQGLTIGAGPKIASAVGSAFAKPVLEVREAITGKESPTYKELYKSGVDLYSAPVRLARKDTPVLSTLAEVGGAILGAGKLAGPVVKGALKIPGAGRAVSALNKQGVLGQAAGMAGRVGLGVGAAEGERRIYEAAEAETGKELDELTQEGFSLFSLLGGVAPLVGGVKAMTSKTSRLPSSKEIKKAASKLYNEAAEKGGILSPEASGKFVRKMFKSVEPENERVRRVFKKGPVGDLLKEIRDEYAGKPMSLDDIQALDEKLTKEASRYFSKVDGAKPEYGEIKSIQNALRQAIQEADEVDVVGGKEGFDALRKAREIYRSAKKFEDVEDIVEKATSQQQPARALRRGFSRLKRSKAYESFSSEEKQLIDKLTEEGLKEEAMKAVTSRLLGLIGMGSGNPVMGGVAYAGGIGARELEKSGMLGKVNRLQGKLVEESGVPGVPIETYQKPLEGVLRRGLQIGAATGALSQ